jgi:TolA-binding protein
MARSGAAWRRSGLLLLALLLAASSCADPARDRYEEAERALLSQHMETALAGFRALAREYPQSRYAPVSLLRLGDLYGSYYRDFPAALEAYGSLVFNYPRVSEVALALLRSAEIHLLQDLDAASAAADLERVRRAFPRFERMDEALFLLAQAYGALRDGDRQNAALSELIARYPRTHRAAEARWMLAYAFLGQRRYGDAEREFRKLLFLAPEPGVAARARWGVAQSLEGNGDLPGAIAEYKALQDTWADPEYVAGKIARLQRRAREREKEAGDR